MKNNTSSSRALEKFKIFPYIAWGLIILFAFFVYKITLELKTVTQDLGTQNEHIQMQINNLESKVNTLEKTQKN